MANVVIAPIESPRARRRRARRVAMQAGVALTLTFAILALIFSLGIDRAAAAQIDAIGLVGEGSRFTVGALLLTMFAGLCALTSLMLRDMLGEQDDVSDRPRNRQG
ncbi:hypothetical protein [Bosea sp. 117]|uniref:hypothetical protein n=1 Tax=Bosea sp. 117 TaxID=1125973 RepID=UPI0006920645|nr:hypothetical protein [Bosea sp. 117]